MLTVRVRVGIGMTAVVGLGAITAALAQWGLQSATLRVNSLHESADARNAATEVLARIAEARQAEILFVTTHDPSKPGEVAQKVQAIEALIAELKKSPDEKVSAKVPPIATELKEWHDDFKRLVGMAAKRGFDPKAESELKTLMEALTEAEACVDQIGDEQVRDLSLMARLAAFRAFSRRTGKEREEFAKKYDALSRQLWDRLAVIRTDSKVDAAARARFEAAWKTYQDTLVQIIADDAQIASVEEEAGKVAEELRAAATAVADTAHTMLDEQAKAIQVQNDRTHWLVLLGSAANIAIALILGGFTIHDLNRRLRQIAHGLDDGAADLRAAAASVATTATRLSDRTAQQASNLEETSASIEELTATTRQNADNASSASNLAQKAKRAAEQGNSSMTELHGAMGEIRESAARIARIIEVIKEIAFQTNLLALNAAVEAARAGEHGRGFAVVAEEVRNLAQRAAASAKETSTIIGASVQTAEKGGRIVDGVVLDQRQIVEDVQQVARLMEEIAAASREQAEGVGQINTAVVTIDKLTQQNSSAAETGAAAAEELAGQAKSVGELVDALVELVQGPVERAITVVRERRQVPGAAAPPEPEPPRRVRRNETTAEVPSLSEDELKEF